MSKVTEVLTCLGNLEKVQPVPLQDRLFLMEVELQEELRTMEPGTNLLLKLSLGRLIRLLQNTRQGLPPSLFALIVTEIDPRG